MGMHNFCLNRQPEKLCLHRGGGEGTEKHTCALTSGTFMCCNVVSMGKTSVSVCEKAARHLVKHLQQL